MKGRSIFLGIDKNFKNSTFGSNPIHTTLVINELPQTVCSSSGQNHNEYKVLSIYFILLCQDKAYSSE